MARGSIVTRGRSSSVVCYVDGRQRGKSLGPVTHKEAERHLREILNEIQDGTCLSATTATAASSTATS